MFNWQRLIELFTEDHWDNQPDLTPGFLNAWDVVEENSEEV